MSQEQPAHLRYVHEIFENKIARGGAYAGQEFVETIINEVQFIEIVELMSQKQFDEDSTFHISAKEYSNNQLTLVREQLAYVSRLLSIYKDSPS